MAKTYLTERDLKERTAYLREYISMQEGTNYLDMAKLAVTQAAPDAAKTIGMDMSKLAPAAAKAATGAVDDVAKTAGSVIDKGKTWLSQHNPFSKSTATAAAPAAKQPMSKGAKLATGAGIAGLALTGGTGLSSAETPATGSKTKGAPGIGNAHDQAPAQGNPEVKKWQEHLNSLGANIKVDGIPGPQTQAAYDKFLGKDAAHRQGLDKLAQQTRDTVKQHGEIAAVPDNTANPVEKERAAQEADRIARQQYAAPQAAAPVSTGTKTPEQIADARMAQLRAQSDAKYGVNTQPTTYNESDEMSRIFKLSGLTPYTPNGEVKEPTVMSCQESMVRIIQSLRD